MTVTIVHIWVNPENVKAFLQATKENHEQSIKEPGNLRFFVGRAKAISLVQLRSVR